MITGDLSPTVWHEWYTYTKYYGAKSRFIKTSVLSLYIDFWTTFFPDIGRHLPYVYFVYVNSNINLIMTSVSVLQNLINDYRTQYFEKAFTNCIWNNLEDLLYVKPDEVVYRSSVCISMTKCKTELTPWASCQIQKIAGFACVGNAGNVSPATDFKGNG